MPSARALGNELGALTGRMMTEAGIDLRTDVQISGFVDAGRRTGVAFTDGTRVEADVAVVGIGGVPRLGWIADRPTATVSPAGPTGRVEGRLVWAVGDIAAWAIRCTGPAPARTLDQRGRPGGDRGRTSSASRAPPWCPTGPTSSG